MPKKYSTKQLLDAVTAVRSKSLSVRKAAVKYGVPVMTIQDRVSGKVEDMSSAGRPTVLPLEVEDYLVVKIKAAAVKGFGITRRMLAVKVGRIARRLKLKTPFRNGVPGKDWVSGFLKRHPDLAIRSPTALSTVRARMLNETVTSKYFKTLSDLVSDLNLEDKPHCIWNMDETSVPLIHKPSKVLAETGIKNIPGRVGNSRDNVSVLGCINASGSEIPPFVIIKGKTYKSLYAYNTKEGVPGSVYTFQERAWMEDALGELWFDHFLKNCGDERPQLMILDSHSSHETLGLIDAARTNGITLLAFPPHTTQWLCPLDKTVFGPLSREYSRVCSEFMADSPNNLVTKWEWPRLFCKAYTKAFSPENIKSGFRKCGIFPLSPNGVPRQAFAPSYPFDKCSTSVNTEEQTLSEHTVGPSGDAAHGQFSDTASGIGESDAPVLTEAVINAQLLAISAAVMSDAPVIALVESDAPAIAPVVSVAPVIAPVVSVAPVVSDAPLIATVVSDAPVIAPVVSVAPVVSDAHEVAPVESDAPINASVLPEAPINKSSDDSPYQVVSEAEFISSILSGGMYSVDSTGTIQVEVPVADMLSEVNSEFTLPCPSSVAKKTSVRKITCHRVLTSDQIFEKKNEVKMKKEEETKQKEIRKQIRLVKKEKKNVVKKK